MTGPSEPLTMISLPYPQISNALISSAPCLAPLPKTNSFHLPLSSSFPCHWLLQGSP